MTETKKAGRPFGAKNNAMKFEAAPIVREWIESESNKTRLEKGATINSLLMKALEQGITLIPKQAQAA